MLLLTDTGCCHWERQETHRIPTETFLCLSSSNIAQPQHLQQLILPISQSKFLFFLFRTIDTFFRTFWNFTFELPVNITQPYFPAKPPPTHFSLLGCELSLAAVKSGKIILAVGKCSDPCCDVVMVAPCIYLIQGGSHQMLMMLCYMWQMWQTVDTSCQSQFPPDDSLSLSS